MHEAEHDAADDEGGDGRAHEGQDQDGPDVPEEEPLLHAVAGVEDDRRQDDVEEDFRIESCLLIDLRKNWVEKQSLYYKQNEPFRAREIKIIEPFLSFLSKSGPEPEMKTKRFSRFRL